MSRRDYDFGENERLTVENSAVDGSAEAASASAPTLAFPPRIIRHVVSIALFVAVVTNAPAIIRFVEATFIPLLQRMMPHLGGNL